MMSPKAGCLVIVSIVGSADVHFLAVLSLFLSPLTVTSLSPCMPGLLNQSYDDRNDNVFNYQGNWFLNQGVWNASSVGQSGTLASTSDTNANVTFVFPTPAIAFYYYGIPRSRGGSYGICVDCDPNNRIFIPVDGFNATDDGKNPPIVLFSKTFTQPGVHEVIMRNQPDARGTPPGNSELTLDRIDLEVVDNSAGPATITVSPSGQPTNSLTANPASSKSSSPLGAIVGAVLGGLAVLVGILIFLYWLRLRRKYAARAKENALPPISSTTYPGPGGGEGPFVRPYLYSSAATASHPDMQQTAAGTPSTASSPPPSGRPGGYGYGMGKTIPSRTHQRQMASSTSQATSHATTLSTSPPSSSGATQRTPTLPGPRRELDGGPVPLDDADEFGEATLPPDYAQVFAAQGQPNRPGRLSLHRGPQVGKVPRLSTAVEDRPPGRL